MRKGKYVIIHVDDSMTARELVSEALYAVGCEVHSAVSVPEAKERLREFTPDFAVLDLMIDEMDGGFQLCHHVKKLHPACPVVLCSAVKSETGHDFGIGTAEQRRWIGADAWLAKPIRFEELRAQLVRLLPQLTELEGRV